MAYWILSGLVKVYCPLRDGTRVLVRIGGPGDLVGMIDAVAAGARRVQAFQAQAMTKVSVAIFTREHVLALLKTLPSSALVAFLQEANTAWSEMFFWYGWFLGLSYQDRLRWVFEHLAERFGVRDSRGVIITPELSHEELAEMIASSRPMASRLIAEFIQRGELARRDKRYILLKSARREPLRALPQASKAAPGANHNNGRHPGPASERPRPLDQVGGTAPNR